MELDKTIDLYPYRVFTKGGHAFIILVEYRYRDEFDEAIKAAKKKNDTIVGYVLVSKGKFPTITIYAEDISAFDESQGKDPVTNDELYSESELTKVRSTNRKAERKLDKAKESIAKSAPKRKF